MPPVHRCTECGSLDRITVQDRKKRGRHICDDCLTRLDKTEGQVTREMEDRGDRLMPAKLRSPSLPTFPCCKCGGECDGSLGTEPICRFCAYKHYPKQMIALDAITNCIFKGAGA